MINAMRKIWEREDMEKPRVNVFDCVMQGKVDVGDMSEDEEDRFLKSAAEFNKRMER